MSRGLRLCEVKGVANKGVTMWMNIPVRATFLLHLCVLTSLVDESFDINSFSLIIVSRGWVTRSHVSLRVMAELTMTETWGQHGWGCGGYIPVAQHYNHPRELGRNDYDYHNRLIIYLIRIFHYALSCNRVIKGLRIFSGQKR